MAFRAILAIAALSILLAQAGAAGIGSALHSYLSIYLSNSTIGGATFANQSVDGANYVIMQLTGQNQFMVINITKGISFLQNGSQIAPVLTPYLQSLYYPPQSQISTLNSSLQAYFASATGFSTYQQYINYLPNPTAPAGPLADCLVETGLNVPGASCTFANSCESCQHVFNCEETLVNTSGATGRFSIGVQNFSIQIEQLNFNVSTYLSLYNGISKDDLESNLAQMSSALSNISAITAKMPNNPIFPLPSNFSVSEFGNCSGPISTMPWYCVAVSYCESPTFNTSALNTAQSAIIALEALPLSQGAIANISTNSSNLVATYVAPVQLKNEEVLIAKLLNTSLSKYSPLLQSALTLNARFQNASLSSIVTQLEADIKVINSTPTENLSVANATLAADFANLSGIYTNVSAVFSPVYLLALNNTSMALAKQLSFQQIPSKLATYAVEQQQINARISTGGINSIEAQSIYSQEKQIRGGISSILTPLSMAAITKGIDAPLLNPLLQGNQSAAPLAVGLFSFAIGMVLFGIFYYYYYGLKRSHKLKGTPRVQRAWRMLFIGLFAAVIIYALATVSYASSANHFLPIGGFTSAVQGSSIVYVYYNGTSTQSNSSVQSCISTVQGTLQSEQKNLTMISNFSNEAIATRRPILYVSGQGGPTVTYKGFLGNILYVSGSVVSGSGCALASLLQ